MCLLRCSCCIFLVHEPRLFLCEISKNDGFVGFNCTCKSVGILPTIQLCRVCVFKLLCAPHRVGRVLYRNIAWFRNEYAYQKCIYVYVCIFIYSCAGINRWLYVRVFGLKSEWIQNKAVLWIVVLADNVSLRFAGQETLQIIFLSMNMGCLLRPQ